MTELPTPDAHALSHSHALTDAIRDQIEAAGGWIPFSRFMEMALYQPGLGYYSGGSRKFGAAGDFVTAPELSPFFAACLARELAFLLPQTAGVIYEFGAGTGKLAATLLAELDALGQLPKHYYILDLSAELIERQKATLAERVPHLADRVQWLAELPEQFDGVIIGNEVLDAMPCELIHWGPTAQQRGVSIGTEGFVFADRPITDPQLAAIAAALPVKHPDYTSEISLANRAFITSLAQRLVRGGMLFIDYGFGEREYYLPERHMGTLIGHYRHHTVHDPFYLPGLMDLTCHVDFTAIAQTGIDAGLDLIGYVNQAQYLVNLGLAELLEARLNPDDTLPYLQFAGGVQKLVAPHEMGESFKAIGFGKGVDIHWPGFEHGDRCHTL